jgi:hypothetical protein
VVKDLSKRQKTFSSLGFDVHAKQMRWYRFLDEIDVIIPWSKVCRLIEAH